MGKVQVEKYDPEWTVVDACIVVSEKKSISHCIDRLAAVGCVHRGNQGVIEREAFRGPGRFPKHHFYVSPSDSPSPKNHLVFRDYLRANPDAAQEYGALKTSLAVRFPDDVDRYISGKTDFILRILRVAGLEENEIECIGEDQ